LPPEKKRSFVKYVICWKRKRHGSTADHAEAEHRMDDLLEAWHAAHGGIIIHHVLRRTVDSGGGYLLVETDDHARIEAARPVLAGFNFHIDRVLEGAEPD
jgi:hypothetical protein